MIEMSAQQPTTHDLGRKESRDPDAPIRIGVLVGSTRPGRKAPLVAQWVVQAARALPAVAEKGVVLEVVDLAETHLPLLDEAMPAAFGAYEHEHTRAWSQTVARFDAFVIVTPEYNHSVPGVLKNAIDYLYAEWSFAPVGLVGFGLTGGVRAVEHLRQVMTEVRAVPTGSQVALSVFEDFTYADMSDPTSPATVAPRDHQSADVENVINDVLTLAHALGELRRGVRAQVRP